MEILVKRSTSLILGILGIVLVLLLVNGVSRNLLSRFYFDLTEDSLYSLSKGTKNILSSIEQPVTFKYYFSRTEGAKFPQIKLYGARILDLLRQYERDSNGKLTLEIYDPRPDTEEEEWADKYGLSGIPGPGGEKLFLGLVGVNSLGNEEVVPLFNFGRQEYLEYDITRVVSALVHPKKPVVGLLTSLELSGAGQLGQDEGWFMLQQLEQAVQVKKLQPELKSVDKDVDLLLLVHPKNLSEETLFAIDQFVMRGGKLIAYVDPYCQADLEQSADPNNPMAALTKDSSSSLNKLTAKWGVELIEKNVVGDLGIAARVDTGRGEGNIRSFIAWPNLTRDEVNAKDVITSSLENLVLPWAGALKVSQVADVTSEVLLHSSSRSQLLDETKVKFGGGDPDALIRNFIPSGESYPFAVRLRGKLQSNFPEGLKGATGDEPLKESATNANVIVVADVDFLSNRYSVQVQRIFGTRIAQLLNDNLNFFQNATENLLGSDDLISIRSRGQFTRPFTVVERMEADAQQEWQLEEMKLQAELNNANQRLTELQSKVGGDSKQIVSKAVLEEIEQFKERRRDAQKRLRDVRRNLRQGIERLGQNLFLLNTFAVPTLLILVTLFLNFSRRK